jgi:ribonuclease P protein component
VTDDVAASAQPPVGPVRPGRLSRSEDVQRALRRGRTRSGDLLAVHAFRRPSGDVRVTGPEPMAVDRVVDPGGARLTVVASRRVGGAVRRNRAKRLLREAARVRRWTDGVDVVLVARAACAGSDARLVGAELERLGRVLGVLEEPS